MLLSYTVSTYSQSISIELSAKWYRGHDIFNEDSIIYYPELIITYRNNSDTNLYFRKVSQGHYGLPFFIKSGLLQYPICEYVNPDIKKRPKNYGNYSANNYSVEIGDITFLQPWFVTNDNLKIVAEQEIDMINDNLADIYEFIYHEYYKEQADPLGNDKTHYSVSDLLPEMILDKYKDKFVFLRPGEFFSDTYNLVGFQLLKACFTFCINPFLPEYVYTTPFWDNNQSKYIDIKTPLPKVVGDYKLYSGNFNTNKITIAF